MEKIKLRPRPLRECLNLLFRIHAPIHANIVQMRNCIVILVLVVGCKQSSEGDSRAEANNAEVQPANESATSACERIFSAAANIPDTQDSVSDLDKAVTACSSLDEWTAASKKFPKALDGADPKLFLTNRCKYGEISAELCTKMHD